MLCVCMRVCEPTAPSMSHFKVLSLPASWHLLTPTIIMLIYIVWLHKVIYAQFYSMAAQGCAPLLLNVLKRTFPDSRTPLLGSFLLTLLCFLVLLSRALALCRRNSKKAPAKSWMPLPIEKIKAKLANWAMLCCSRADDESRSVPSQSSLASYWKW